jgi:hypothetical protein
LQRTTISKVSAQKAQSLACQQIVWGTHDQTCQRACT